MKSPEEFLAPDTRGFEVDPIGYSALAWHKWGMAQTVAGFPVDITCPPTHRDLNSPILWLSQAHALSEAAVNVVKSDPNLDHFSIYTKGLCHSQYHAVALMLVGLSLETGLKAMMIIRDGIDAYIETEKRNRHHRLRDLAEFVPEISDKDLAILEALTHFIYWAGKYPDPGSGRENDAVDVFEISERYEITGKDLFSLSARILNHAETLLEY